MKVFLLLYFHVESEWLKDIILTRYSSIVFLDNHGYRELTIDGLDDDFGYMIIENFQNLESLTINDNRIVISLLKISDIPQLQVITVNPAGFRYLTKLDLSSM